MDQSANNSIHKAVRERYGKVAESDNSDCGCSASSCCDEPSHDESNHEESCCEESCCDGSSHDESNHEESCCEESCCDGSSHDESAARAKAISMELGYSYTDVNRVPEGANMGLGCGNPKTFAALKPGETVLDLGSGGGFDCFLAAQEVGESGKVIGVDMTPEMVLKARANADKVGYKNVDFRLGEIEHLPVANHVIDVIISNCVINLSPEKPKVFQELYRVLKAGGRLAISDIVATAELPEKLKNKMLTDCMSGALSREELEAMLKNAGFEAITIQSKDESRAFIRKWVPDSKIEDYIISVAIKAIKPTV